MSRAKENEIPEIEDPGTVIEHLEAALEKTDDEDCQHHIRHALLYLGQE